jgi:hypothetical protein
LFRKTFESSDGVNRISQEKELNMKPTNQSIENENGRKPSRPFPLTDYNYHSLALGGFSGRRTRASGPSFHSISRDYLNTEDRHYFLAEAFVYSAFMAVAVLPLVNVVHAVLNLARAFGGV